MCPCVCVSIGASHWTFSEPPKGQSEIGLASTGLNMENIVYENHNESLNSCRVTRLLMQLSHGVNGAVAAEKSIFKMLPSIYIFLTYLLGARDLMKLLLLSWRELSTTTEASESKPSPSLPGR